MSSSYTVWDRPAALRQALPVLGAGVVAVVLAAFADRWVTLIVVLPVLALVAGARARRAGRALSVSARGLVLRGRPATWRSVAALRLETDGGVEVVLSADAPLPSWMGSRISDPSAPADRVRYRESVPGLDPGRFRAALREITAADHVVVESS